jgi:hypothetical protein
LMRDVSAVHFGKSLEFVDLDLDLNDCRFRHSASKSTTVRSSGSKGSDRRTNTAEPAPQLSAVAAAPAASVAACAPELS